LTKFKSNILKGTDSQDNKGNRDWWEENPMTYDWDKELGELRNDKEYFKSVDNIFGEGHSLINNPEWPKGKILENFIPYDEFDKQDILEIGCGVGLVASHIAQSGAKLSAIDLTNQAVEITRKRFEINNIKGSIQQMDAESLQFKESSFDFIVSWGVIHHSGNMKEVLNEVHRVLRPGGRAYIMVYNKNSIRYQVYCRFWLGVMKLGFLNKSLDEIVGSITDGHIARHLEENEFIKLTQAFNSVRVTFSDEKTTILKYLLGIGKPFKYFYPLTKPIESWLAKRWGWYLEAVLEK
jgi:2-polyprenyl-3-methyl-5-hydroxy-6-metoxy-1,4-benzoquinol methylase